MNLVYGFGGMRSDGDTLSFEPAIPRKWKGFSFRVLYRGSVLEVSVDKEAVALRTVEGSPVRVTVFGRPKTGGAHPFRVPLPASRRA
jgi:maltose phosphorylase